MNLAKQLWTKNPMAKQKLKMLGGKPVGIMLHSTGANNPDVRRYVGPNKYDNDWDRYYQADGSKSLSVHAFIGRDSQDGAIKTIQTMDWDLQTWHCGGAANTDHISIEMCEDALTDRRYFQAVIGEAVDLCVMLCNMYRLSPSDIVSHAEGNKRGIASAHGDPDHWMAKMGYSMDKFRQEVDAKLNPKDETADLPLWAKPTVQKLLRKGYMQGTGNGKLDLTYDMMRILVILDRAGNFGD